MKNRVSYCDALRFLAIFSVIVIHVIADLRTLYLPVNKDYYFLFSLIDSITRAGVPLFFMFTGIFLLSRQKNEPYKVTVKSTIKKLIIPLIIASFAYYCYNCFIDHKSVFSLKQFIIDLYSNNIKYHLWYMYAIILIYLLIPFLKTGIQNMKRQDLKNLIILIFLLGSLPSTINQFCIYLNLPTLEVMSYPIILTQINYLFLGYYLYHYDISEKLKKKIYILGILSIICMPILDSLLTNDKRWDPFFPPNIIFPFLYTSAVFIFVKSNYNKWKIPQKIQKFFELTASLSIYIYLSHVMILEITRRVLYHYFTPSSLLENLGLFSVFLLITAIGSFIFSYLLKKVVTFIKKKISNKKLAINEST